MLSQFMVNNFRYRNYSRFNDELLYIDRLDLRHNFDTIIIEPHRAYKYEGNFYGLLNEIGVSPSLYLYALYLNKLNSPVDYKADMLIIKKPVQLNIPKK